MYKSSSLSLHDHEVVNDELRSGGERIPAIREAGVKILGK